MAVSHCPCQSGKTFADCCGLYLQQEQWPPSPLALMRSRYTAFVRGDIDYIQSTQAGPASAGFDAVSARQDSGLVTWVGLEIIDAPIVVVEANKGVVEFIASYHDGNSLQRLHERSEFHFINGRWFYVDGTFIKN